MVGFRYIILRAVLTFEAFIVTQIIELLSRWHPDLPQAFHTVTIRHSYGEGERIHILEMDRWPVTDTGLSMLYTPSEGEPTVE